MFELPKVFVRADMRFASAVAFTRTCHLVNQVLVVVKRLRIAPDDFVLLQHGESIIISESHESQPE